MGHPSSAPSPWNGDAMYVHLDTDEGGMLHVFQMRPTIPYTIRLERIFKTHRDNEDSTLEDVIAAITVQIKLWYCLLILIAKDVHFNNFLSIMSEYN